MGNIGEIEEIQGYLSSSTTMPLLALNHVSFVCKSVSNSVRFYEDVLGFVLIKRPSSFDFEGAWLFNYGIGIHLLESDNAPTKKSAINPKDNHISFQCSDMNRVIRKLEEMNIEYVTAVVKEGGITVDQLFFHDPDGYMVEICNCQNLPVLPLMSCPLKLAEPTRNNTIPSFYEENAGKRISEMQCYGEAEELMMENFMLDMMTISI
ncbi:virulence protein STM3117-like isoform X1 [Juglans microcarpa x Juglans regia]|uniref:virulence protein STM3117-like isoform X1 n=1 Tax=Juglans microcarpa x Juglans regia TaxID=2249226 RepID=UPI001B7F60F4|nr:virulence protein STM3117-like isoform X1 [Juglans microcarpa x Juglans regia]